MSDNDQIDQIVPFNETIKCASYGATSSRKTLQIGTLIETYGAENVGVINAEHGLRTIASKIDQRYVFVADNLEGVRTGWQWAKDNGFTAPDKWLCVDGGSRVLQWVNHEIFIGAQRALDGVIAGTPKQALDPAVRKYASYIEKEISLNSQQMWWRTGYECERLLDSFIKLSSNMYWTFWEDQTSISQYVKGVPWIPETPGKGALAAVKGAFDFIFRLVGEGDNSTAYFRNPAGNATNYTKTRDDWSGGFKVPDKIENFNLAQLVQLITKQPKEQISK